MEDVFVNNTDGISDMHGGNKRRLKTLQMCTKKNPSVEWLCSRIKLLYVQPVDGFFERIAF
jgi:hypothetical protein